MDMESSRFEFAHGSKPKGFGLWAFCFDGGEPEFLSNSAEMWGAAKKRALAEAKRRGASRVEAAS